MEENSYFITIGGIAYPYAFKSSNDLRIFVSILKTIGIEQEILAFKLSENKDLFSELTTGENLEKSGKLTKHILKLIENKELLKKGVSDNKSDDIPLHSNDNFDAPIVFDGRRGTFIWFKQIFSE